MGQPKILIMAGGTGGHVFPGLAVAERLRQQYGAEIHWLGTAQGLESSVVPSHQIPFHTLTISALRGTGVGRWLRAPIVVIRAVRQASRLLKSINPDVVLGMGGFAAGPGGIAALLQRRPLLLHEQNAVAGLTNRVLSPVATRLLQAFPGAFSSSATITCGNPLRSSITPEHFASRTFLRDGRLRILVLGGSGGAQVFNRTLPSIFDGLSEKIPLSVWHQCGKKQIDEAQHCYQSAKMDLKLEPFIENMAEAYEWADVVIARAGALTVSELMAAGLPSLLVPYPHAADQHQALNAKYLERAGAARVILQPEFSEQAVISQLLEWQAQPEKLMAMAKAARALYRPGATETVAQICMEQCREFTPQNAQS